MLRQFIVKVSVLVFTYINRLDLFTYFKYIVYYIYIDIITSVFRCVRYYIYSISKYKLSLL